MPRKPRPMTLVQFMQRFQNEDACRDYLFQQRWPDGFRCPKCGSSRVSAITTRHLWQCLDCSYQASVTAGTVMHHSKLPLATWFLAFFLVSQSKRGISSVELGKQLGVRQQTAWYMLRRIRKAMGQREGMYLLEGLVEMDDGYVGGVCEGRCGRGTDQAKVAVAVSINEEGYPGFAKVAVLDSFTQIDVNDAVTGMIRRGATVLTDGLSSWGGLPEAGYSHKPTPNKDLPEGVEPFPYVHTFISNLKAWIAGTFHGLGDLYLQEYTDEFCFRFNRRQMEPRLFERLVNAVGRSCLRLESA